MTDETEQQTFSIVWIEDRPDTIGPQRKEIELFIKEKGLIPMFFDAKGKDDFENILASRTGLDLIITDVNIEEGFNARDVISKVRKKQDFIDVLAYTNISESTDAAKDADAIIPRYGFIKMVKGKENLVHFAKGIINKNLRLLNDWLYLRGLIISRTTKLEGRMEEFLFSYFAVKAETQSDFKNFILGNTYFTYQGKMEAMTAIVKKLALLDRKCYAEFSEGLHKIGKVRNGLAHCKKNERSPDKIILSTMGQETILGRKEIHAHLGILQAVSEKIEELRGKVPK